jgi:multiple antibiotic resistance protein
MSNWLNSFILTFVPLFVVIDAVGNLPFVIALSGERTRSERRRIVNLAMVTAAVVGLAFLFLGKLILKLMNISVGSFAIAGGLVLVTLSLRYMTTGRMVEVVREEMVAVVPIGTPLTVGPATITTLLLLTTQHPLYIVLISFGLNLLVAWIVFLMSGQISRFLGKGGITAFSRVLSLLLVAIGVSMIVRGLELVGITK